MKPRISLVTLGVRDLATSLRFYRDGLGFVPLASPPEVAFFALNGSWLALYGREDLAADAGVSPEGAGFSGIALAHNVESEAAVDLQMAEAALAGARLVKPAQSTSWGGYAGYFADPDGHLWEIAFNPFLRVGPQD